MDTTDRTQNKIFMLRNVEKGKKGKHLSYQDKMHYGEFGLRMSPSSANNAGKYGGF